MMKNKKHNYHHQRQFIIGHRIKSFGLRVKSYYSYIFTDMKYIVCTHMAANTHRNDRHTCCCTYTIQFRFHNHCYFSMFISLTSNVDTKILNDYWKDLPLTLNSIPSDM